MLETIRKITFFFRSVKDGVYPHLKRAASSLIAFPEVQRRIDNILDRYGEIKDTASDELYSIRKSIKDKESSVSRRINAILKKAQQDGIVDSDAAVSIRDGKMLIPVSSAKKRSLQGFIYDESATGKTTFIEPAEIVEMTNEISELRFAESREIARILMDFAEFLRPYVPELLTGAVFIGEADFLMAKAQVALDMRAGMPIISVDGSLSLRKARHPLLEKALRKEKKEIVPYCNPHEGQAHPPYLRAECRGKISLPQDNRPPPVHVPVGHADTHLRDIGTTCVRQDYGLYRR